MSSNKKCFKNETIDVKKSKLFEPIALQSIIVHRRVFDFSQAFNFSAFLFGDLIFLVLFLSRKKVVQLIIICLCSWLQYNVKTPPEQIFHLLVIPHISFCLDAKRNKKVKAASAKAEILKVRTKIKELGGCSSAFS